MARLKNLIEQTDSMDITGPDTSPAIQITGGPGGGSGAFIDAIITSPGATYPYTIGASGTAGNAGTNGTGGGAGAPGYIEVTEYYQ